MGKCFLCSNKFERSFYLINVVRVVYWVMFCGFGIGGFGVFIVIGYIRVMY